MLGGQGHGGRRLRASRRAVLEGLPLSVLISIIVIAIGTVLILGLFTYTQDHELGSVTAVTPTQGSNGFIGDAPAQLIVTTYDQHGSRLGGVTVALNGTGVVGQQVTSGNGTAYFWIVPVLAWHSTSGTLTVTATYAPQGSYGSSGALQSASTTLVVLQ